MWMVCHEYTEKSREGEINKGKGRKWQLSVTAHECVAMFFIPILGN